MRRRRRHPTIERSPRSILENWYRPVKLRNGLILYPPEGSKERAEKFLKWLMSRREYSPNTLHRYLITFRIVISWLHARKSKSLENMTYEDYLQLMSEIGDRKIPETVKLYLKYLYDIMDDERYLRLYSKIKVPVRKTRPPEILSREQIFRLIEACNQVDYELKLLVELLYETGARVGELLNLRVGDVEFDEYGAKVYIRKSKSEYRTVRVVMFAADLQRYVEGRRMEDYVFTKNYNTLLQYLKDAWRIAGLPHIKRKFHVLRHSRATELMKLGLNERELMLLFGWKTRKMIDVYAHLTLADVESKLLRIYVGEEVEESRMISRKCPRCLAVVPPTASSCPRCGLPLKGEIMIREKTIHDEVEEARRLIDKLVEIALSNPDLLRSILQRSLKQGRA